MSPFRRLLRLFGFVRVRDYGYMLSGDGRLLPLPEVAGPEHDSAGWRLPQVAPAGFAAPAVAPLPIAPPAVAPPAAASVDEADADEWEWQMALARAREQADLEQADRGRSAREPVSSPGWTTVSTPVPQPALEAVLRAAAAVESPLPADRPASSVLVARTFASIMPGVGLPDAAHHGESTSAPRPDATPASVAQPEPPRRAAPEGDETAADGGAPASPRGLPTTPIARRDGETRVMSREPGGTLSHLRARSGGPPVTPVERRPRPSTRATTSGLTRPSVLIPREPPAADPTRARSARGTESPAGGSLDASPDLGEATADRGEVTRVTTSSHGSTASGAITRVASLEEIERAARASVELDLSAPGFEESSPAAEPTPGPAFELEAPPTIIMQRPQPLPLRAADPAPRPASAGPAFEAAPPPTVVMQGPEPDDPPTAVVVVPERKPAPLPRLSDRRRR